MNRIKDLRVLKIFERTLDDQRDFDYEELIFTSSKFKILFVDFFKNYELDLRNNLRLDGVDFLTNKSGLTGSELLFLDKPNYSLFA